MTKSKRAELLESVAGTITDYRAGEIATPTAAHVDHWLKQFDGELQEPLLAELDHVLKNTYLPKATVEEFLEGLVRHPKLAGANPCEFWKTAGLLNIQQGGNSQREILDIFGALLHAECGIRVPDCNSSSGTYLYFDDIVFTAID